MSFLGGLCVLAVKSRIAGKLPALQLESAEADFVLLQPWVFPLGGIPDCRDNLRHVRLGRPDRRGGYRYIPSPSAFIGG